MVGTWQAWVGDCSRKKGKMKHGAKSAVRHKAKGAVKANTRNRWVWGNRIRQDRVPVLIPLTRTDTWLRIRYLTDSLHSDLKRNRAKSQFWNTWFCIFLNRVWLGMKWRAHSTKDAWRVLTEAAGALSISTCLLSLGIVGQICTWYFSAKRCKWKTNDSFKTSNLTSVEGYKRSVLNNLFLSYLNNWEMASGLHFRHSQLKKEILTKFLKIYFTNKWGVFWVVKQYPNNIWEEASVRSYSQKVKLN